MNTYKKMVMLSIDEYSKLQSLMYTTQVVPAVNPLQKEMAELKERYGDNLPDDQRNKLEAEIIQKYADKPVRQHDKPQVVVDKSQTEWIKNSIGDFTKTNRTRANQLYNLLNTRLSDRWNENGELLTSDGGVIKGSNILDLVDYVTTTQRSKQVPIGFNDFKLMLNESNVPTYVYSKRGLDNINKHVIVEDVENLFKEPEEEEYKTPPTKRKLRSKKLYTSANKSVWLS